MAKQNLEVRQLDSKQLQFGKSFAEAVQQQQHHKNLQPTNLTFPVIETNEMEDDSTDCKRMRSISIEKNIKIDGQKCLTEVVCVHPDISNYLLHQSRFITQVTLN